MLKLAATAAAFTVAASAAMAVPLNIDFESEFPGVDGATNVGTSVDLGQGVTASVLTLGENIGGGEVAGAAIVDSFLQYVAVGGPNDQAFVPNDNPDGDFGTTFLTGDFSGNTGMKLTFDEVVRNLMFDIADIDGSGSGQETFTFVGFLGGVEVANFSRVAGVDANTGDRAVTPIDFLPDVDMVLIYATDPGNNRNIGWGIDNIEATVVPLPAGLLLSLTALGGLGLLRARRKG